MGVEDEKKKICVKREMKFNTLRSNRTLSIKESVGRDETHKS